ncbi:phosphate ABC transporter substrate-binding protein [Aestuariibacter sp. A3R04]|uniref:phosphate ABC transporter substrate-binding protein n=1 Tax=Aestuariibacter sp. A3R04 TaxID=2841571 RepID=UPI001C086953|nr:phosphate ABC transporter substrate-binding protein [Aestuariibacter sp. A3R04]MBU3020243.1 phosphate ABC transporter substrate-binding protein [Aestuariibacter sp. A3R04]
MKITKVTLKAVAFGLLVSSQALADVAVIVNPSYAGSADKEVVSQIFLGKDKSLTPFMQKGAVADEFIDKVLSRNSGQFKAYWAKLSFTGGGRPPKELGSDADVLNQVSSDTGAIGFVDAGAVNDSVKVLFTM